MKKGLLLLLFIGLCIPAICIKAQINQAVNLIPYPQKLELNKGSFTLSTQTQLISNDKGLFTNEIAYFQSMITPLLGKSLTYQQGKNSIEFDYVDAFKNGEDYKLTITPDKVKVEASGATGVFYAIQTIRQLLPVQTETATKINGALLLPAMQVSDQPAFSWRGSMIDVSRHFFSIEYLKRHIDRMALYKMNKLHLHLTDDQGWRIEIKKYPELTQNGAWRTFNNQDTVCMTMAKDNPDMNIDSRYIINKDGKQLYGGYYTQDQLKDLINYATKHHVEIIPEIDMPGHMLAAIHAYPYLTDMENAGWGKLFSTPLNPCKDEVYTFVENVLSEIISLFPSSYIHIGADEVDKTAWSHSDLCKSFMKEKGIKDYEELQTYFVHKVANYIQSKGKKVITWDDAIDGELDPSINVMYWRGWVRTSLPKAAQNGNPVIMSPTNPLYFDYIPDRSSLRAVYDMNVIDKSFTAGKENLVKGAQANLWTEKVPSEQRADFMMFPRLIALAERLWTNKNLYDDFYRRLLANFNRLDALNVHYRLPDLSGFALESVFVKETMFDVENPLPGMSVHYTMDGSIPTINSPKLETALKIDKPLEVKFALFSPSGARGDIYTVNYKQMPMAKPAKVNGKLSNGLVCSFYDGMFKSTANIKAEKDKEVIVSNLVVPKEFATAAFALKYRGYIKVPATGIYSFFFTCDDGGKLYIANRTTVDNDGLHSAIEKSGQAALSKGIHPFALDFVEGGGGFTLKLQYSFNGSAIQDIPDSWFVH
jgi:hexosaminidase